MKTIFTREITIDEEDQEIRNAQVGEYCEKNDGRRFYKAFSNYNNRMLLWSKYGKYPDKNNFEGHYNIGRVDDYTKFFIRDKADIFVFDDDKKSIFVIDNETIKNLIETKIMKTFKSKYDKNELHFFAPVDLCKFYKKYGE